MQRSLLLLLLFCAGCSTMKDVGAGMQVGGIGGGYGGVALLGSVIEAAADLGDSGGAASKKLNAKQLAEKRRKDAAFEAVVGDFVAYVELAEKNNTLKPIKEEAEVFCSSMEKRIEAREYNVQLKIDEGSTVSSTVVTLSEDPFEGDCEKVLIRRGKVALASLTP